MPQLILPGHPVAIGLEASLFAALVQTFGFKANVLNDGFGAQFNLATIAMTGAIVFAWASFLKPASDMRVDKDGKKTYDYSREVFGTSVDYNNTSLRSSKGKLKLKSPYILAAVNAGAFAGASIMAQQGVMTGDIAAIGALAFMWNTYLHQYVYMIESDIVQLEVKALSAANHYI